MALITALGAGLMAAMHIDSELGIYLLWSIVSAPAAMMLPATGAMLIAVTGVGLAASVPLAGVLVEAPWMLVTFFAIAAAASTYLLSDAQLTNGWRMVQIFVLSSFWVVVFDRQRLRLVGRVCFLGRVGRLLVHHVVRQRPVARPRRAASAAPAGRQRGEDTQAARGGGPRLSRTAGRERAAAAVVGRRDERASCPALASRQPKCAVCTSMARKFSVLFRHTGYIKAPSLHKWIRRLTSSCRYSIAVSAPALRAAAPGRYEIPPDVIREAIVNAIAHRDYTSAGAVQVSVFADRVEVWNPGNLPAPLTTESLRHPHGSIARNHRLCEVLYLAQYIEKYGTGTLMMIDESIAYNLPEPVFIQRGGEFTITLWRDWLTDEVLAGYDLNERQTQAVAFVKAHGRITNREYRNLTGVIIRTSSRDIEGSCSQKDIE